MNDPRPNHAPVTVGIVSKHHLVRIGLQAALTSQPTMQFVGEATGALDAEKLVAGAHPRVLVIEMAPDIDMRELVRAVKSSGPTTRIIVISGIEDAPYGAGSVSSGIDGIVLTMQPPVVLVATIHHVCCLRATTTVYDRNARSHRTPPMDAPIREKSPPCSTKSPDTSLTGREREIIELLGQALSNKDIADRLCISSITVRHHLTNIFEKFDVNSRQQLLLRAYEHGLVTLKAYH
ncbi:MAG: response regulator transcription factor [Nitrospira sp.]|nr:response regulator transcription factor [Nitrospira sp.]